MITAKGETFDKVLGLELGADDYVVKPFEAKEIVARIKAVMRRTGKSSSSSDTKEVSYDKLVVNMTKYELKVDGKVIDTPAKGAGTFVSSGKQSKQGIHQRSAAQRGMGL